MGVEESFDRTRGRLRIVSAGIFNQYKVVVEGMEIHGTFGGDVLNSLARGEYTHYQVIQTRFNEQADRLPPGLTADRFFFWMRGFGPVTESMPPPLTPQNPPAATA